MKFAVLLVLMAASWLAQAEGVANTYEVDQVRVDKSGKGYIKFKQTLTGTQPSCAQALYATVLAFDTNQAAGKAIMSIALAAQASGKKIFAVGANNCEAYGGQMEDWGWGYIQS